MVFTRLFTALSIGFVTLLSDFIPTAEARMFVLIVKEIEWNDGEIANVLWKGTNGYGWVRQVT